jgi:cyclohexyl-isocyanide hydratase
MSQPYRVGFLLWPGLTQLDMTGPAQVLSRIPGAEMHYAWKVIEPIPSDCGLPLMPTITLADCPQLDILCVPGGAPVAPIMRDAEVLGWLRKQAAGAEFVTSVCTGSLILAAAGLLQGYRAGCHWAWGYLLPLFGTEFVEQRTIFDRNRVTAGGVTSGIDFAFRLIEHKFGRDVAEAIQLSIEYDPEPVAGGTPRTARPEVLDSVRSIMTKRLGDHDPEIRAIASHFQPS